MRVLLWALLAAGAVSQAAQAAGPPSDNAALSQRGLTLNPDDPKILNGFCAVRARPCHPIQPPKACLAAPERCANGGPPGKLIPLKQ
jgi:hypothetical protein